MNETFRLVLALAAGLALGAFFFAGLWWTVRRCLTAKHPALLMVGSLLVRTAALLSGFYWVSGSSWQRLVACALGFFTAKWIATRHFAAPKDANPQEQVHAP